MNNEQKIKKQARELRDAGAHVVHYGDMAKMAVQALQYIATGGKNLQPEESKILLLNKIGIPGPQNSVTPPHIVAMECLELIQAMNQKHMEESKPGYEGHDAAPPTTKLDEVRLIDGETITLSTKFDAFFHRCCDCGLSHSVVLDWISKGDEPILDTKWTRVEEIPSVDELLSGGGSIVSIRESKSSGKSH